MEEGLNKPLLAPENFSRDGIDLLRTSQAGLPYDDAEAQLQIFGPNKLEEKRLSSTFSENKILKFLLSFMWNPLSWVMEAAATMGIVLANGGVVRDGIWQEQDELFWCFCDTCNWFLSSLPTGISERYGQRYSHLAAPRASANIKDVQFLPFNPVDKRTAITYIDTDGNWYRASKGATEQLLSRDDNETLPVDELIKKQMALLGHNSESQSVLITYLLAYLASTSAELKSGFFSGAGLLKLRDDIQTCGYEDVQMISITVAREDSVANLQIFPAQLYNNEKSFGASKEIGGSSRLYCDICMEEKERYDMIKHSFCSDCLSRLIQAKIEGNIHFIACPNINCNDIIEPDFVKGMIPENVVARWEEVRSEATILDSQKFYCPYKNCSAMLVSDAEEEIVIRESECPVCRRLFCAKCRVPWHPGFECEEFQKLKMDERENDDLKMHALAREVS
ncbi:hypothetical protein ACH5RR_024695 [Cinchona calisaya]|uniref:RBR-type E3 ubiquitin transferase n=1 Tax=Cinchona calisaya TaxID=153742 RepID=A0ABD2YXG1_9GENT